jgi:hypothetical protein
MSLCQINPIFVASPFIHASSQVDLKVWNIYPDTAFYNLTYTTIHSLTI